MFTVHTRMFPATRESQRRGQTVPRQHHHLPAACTITTITWGASWRRLRLQSSATTSWETCPPVLMLAATQAAMCSSCSIWASQVSTRPVCRPRAFLQAGPQVLAHVRGFPLFLHSHSWMVSLHAINTTNFEYTNQYHSINTCLTLCV
jgi:hypothetical protein